MLNLYRRHTATCTKKYPQHDRTHMSCKCMVYVEGKIKRGTPYVKESTGTRSMEEARRMVVAAEARGSWGPVHPVETGQTVNSCLETHSGRNAQESRGKSVNDAADHFLAEAASPKGRNLAPSTVKKYRTLLTRLKDFSSESRFQTLNEIDLESLRAFRDSWPTSSHATSNNIRSLRTFYKFCVEQKWADHNTAAHLACPKYKHVQKVPFTDDEFHRILDGVARLDWDPQQAVSRLELECFILIMRYTGLRISDAALLTSDRLEGSRLRLHQIKAGEWVVIPLPLWLSDMFRRIRPTNGYLFCRGSKRLETVTDLWRRRINQVFDEAGIEGTPHQFRHTFAVDFLSKGVSIEHVSTLLGHSSVKITERHYAAWVKSRQDALTAEVERVHGTKPGLYVVNC